MDLGVLLTLPLESIALRAVIAALSAIVLVRLLLRVGVRAPSNRVATALAPALALAAVVALAGSSLQLPALMVPVDAAGGLAIPVDDGFVYFAPLAVPLVVGVWALVAALRLGRRGLAIRGARRMAQRAQRDGTPIPEVSALATDVARALKLTTPSVVVLPRVTGGAVVIGHHRPVVILDRDLVDRFDADELEAVLAHELAHVHRRDNLMATLLGVVRDVAFFVPGGGWAVRQLHRERELAADQVAVSITGRPGALASGLLKVLESAPRNAQPCAAFAPGGGLVDRVRILVDDQPVVSARRRVAESVAVVATIIVATLLALVLPTVLAGGDRQRDAMALVWATSSTVDQQAPDFVAEARAFDVYRRSSFEVAPPTAAAPTRFDEPVAENRRATIRACATSAADCPSQPAQVGLGLRPRPSVEVGTHAGWQATPVVERIPGDGIQLFWLARVQ